MLGFSVYLDKDLTADDHNYLLGMRNAGFNEVFTSLTGLNDEADVILKRLNQLTGWCKDLELKIIADVSQDDLHRLGYDLDDVEKLKTLNVTGLRINDQVLMRFVSKLSKSMWVSLNAIYLQPEDITHLKEEAANFDHIRALFDFYSQPETGMADDWFEEKNRWLRKCNLETAAFIAGDRVKRGSFFAGKTTLESQRGIYPLAAALNLKKLSCSNVIVGDRLTSETIKTFARYTKDYVITLHLDKKVPFLEENEWHNYLYVARDIVRLHNEDELPKFEAQDLPLDRLVGTVTVNSSENLNSGEIHIAKRDLPASQKVRILGKVDDSECSLLSNIEPGQKIVFKNLEK
ncbi:MupG family TIM beta-alpha barrel fold protein [Lactobacillus taiwanensis]|uniref:MupG family TIM beta-alpha barrel fold protein n=1 Tax=Lactobacillus taiwanensis TaxID=508451 RepID=UPI0025B1CABD|nr:MupG family TIM beta-alpha barrel fold protein [Lactobacillus taiwanensis]